MTPLHLALLGDSLAHGTGAARPSEGLGPRLAAALSAAGLVTVERVLAVPGARSADLADQVARGASWRPDLALVVVGANDLVQQVPVHAAAEQLGRAVLALRARGADVLVVPAPDLSVLAAVPTTGRGLVRAASALLRAAQVDAVVTAGGQVLDLDDALSPAFASDPALFSADRFHPSSAGYARIAAALLPAVLGAARGRALVADDA